MKQAGCKEPSGRERESRAEFDDQRADQDGPKAVEEEEAEGGDVIQSPGDRREPAGQNLAPSIIAPQVMAQAKR